jgi:hypothetical protein
MAPYWQDSQSHLADRDFPVKAMVYKTARVANDKNDIFRLGEFVSIEMSGAIGPLPVFHATLDGREAYITALDLDSFVL